MDNFGRMEFLNILILKWFYEKNSIIKYYGQTAWFFSCICGQIDTTFIYPFTYMYFKMVHANLYQRCFQIKDFYFCSYCTSSVLFIKVSIY